MESEILAIRRVEFIDIISEYPEIKEELLKVVQIRQHFHKKAEIFAKKTNLKLIGITWNRIQSQTAVGSIYNIKVIYIYIYYIIYINYVYLYRAQRRN